jgi:hypothetical protein
MPASEVSIDFVIKQDSTLRNDITKSKTRSLIALLASTYLLYYWFDSVATLTLKTSLDSYQFLFPLRTRLFLIMPAVFNLLGWAYWGFSQYLANFKAIKLKSSDTESEDVGYKDVLDQYQLTRLNYRRQRFSELIVNFVIAMQLVAMGMMVFSYGFTIR